MNEKYVVFKRDDFWHILQESKESNRRRKLIDGEVPDAVVIRRQDVFAGPALHAYAASISVAVQFIPNHDVAKRLQAIADYFHEQALAADEAVQKVPD